MAHRQTDTGKNIINEEKRNFVIEDHGDFLNLKIDKKFLTTSDGYEINKLLNLALSPFFVNENKSIPKQQKISLGEKQFPHIAFFIECMPHYTGGRYSLWHQAAILSNYTNVTVVTNQRPIFYNDFKDYYSDNFRMVVSTNFLIDQPETDFDVIVGVPNISGQYATEYSNIWKLPLYLVMFESPNYISAYRDGVDANEDFWTNYKKCLKQADAVILPSEESEKWFKMWDVDFKNKKTYVLNPCINEAVAKNFKKKKTLSGKKIVYISRMTQFKNPIQIIKELGEYEIDIIGKIWKDEKDKLEKFKNVKIHSGISDKEKFKIISSADVIIFPTKFEGFGMPPMEGIYYNIPVVTYFLPVLYQNYGKNIHYVDYGNHKEFVKTVKNVLKLKKVEDKWYRISHFASVKSCANKMLDIFNIPKVTTGTIVHDGSDYLEYAINSLYNYLYEIIIVEGAVKGYSDKPNNPDDVASISRLLKKDVVGKIKYYSSKGKFWNDKIEMQNVIASHVTGRYYVKLDSDEIWKPETLMDVIRIMEQNLDITVLRMPFLHFWLSFNLIAKDAGGKWNTKHPRVWRWKKSYVHYKSFNHFQDKNFDMNPVTMPFVNEYTYRGDYIFHFGYVRELKKLLNKLKYYGNRNIEKYVSDTISNWNKLDDPTQPTQKVRSWAETFTGELPEILQKHPYKNIKDIRKEGVQ